MVMQDFNGLKTMTFHCLADIAFSDLQLLFSVNVTPETCPITLLKAEKIQDREHFEIVGSKHSLI